MVCSPYLVYVGFLDLGLLGAGAGRAGEVPVPLHYAWSLQQARDTEHCTKKALLVLQTIRWVFGLDVLHQNLHTMDSKKSRLRGQGMSNLIESHALGCVFRWDIKVILCSIEVMTSWYRP